MFNLQPLLRRQSSQHPIIKPEPFLLSTSDIRRFVAELRSLLAEVCLSLNLIWEKFDLTYFIIP